DSNGEIKDPVFSLPEEVKAGILFQESSREQANFHDATNKRSASRPKPGLNPSAPLVQKPGCGRTARRCNQKAPVKQPVKEFAACLAYERAGMAGRTVSRKRSPMLASARAQGIG